MLAYTPSVLNQGFPARIIPKDKLILSANNRHYNGSICAFNQTRYMAYRAHVQEGGRCQIAICEVDDIGMPIRPSQFLELPGRKNGEHHEDPRLFVFQGALHMAFTAASDYDGRFKCQMRLVELRKPYDKFVVVDEIPIHYRHNDLGREKNWQFFSIVDRLFFTYALDPHIVVEIHPNTGDVLNEWEGQGISNWRRGTLSGSTPPVLWCGSWLSVFHSATTHPFRVRRYSASAYRFELEPPFNILEVTEPFIFGSEHDGFLKDPREEKIIYEPLVVFPAGSAWKPDGKTLVVSAGFNDHGLCTFDIDPDNLSWRSPKFSAAARYFFTDMASLTLRGGKETCVEFEKTKLVEDQWQGVLMTRDPEAIALARERWDVKEISREEFARHIAEADTV